MRDAALLVSRRHEQLVEDDRPLASVMAQRDVARRLGLLARDEDQILLEHLEHAVVAPPRHVGEGRPGEAEQEAQFAGLRFADLHGGVHHAPFIRFGTGESPETAGQVLSIAEVEVRAAYVASHPVGAVNHRQ